VTTLDVAAVALQHRALSGCRARQPAPGAADVSARRRDGIEPSIPFALVRGDLEPGNYHLCALDTPLHNEHRPVCSVSPTGIDYVDLREPTSDGYARFWIPFRDPLSSTCPHRSLSDGFRGSNALPIVA